MSESSEAEREPAPAGRAGYQREYRGRRRAIARLMPDSSDSESDMSDDYSYHAEGNTSDEAANVSDRSQPDQEAVQGDVDFVQPGLDLANNEFFHEEDNDALMEEDDNAVDKQSVLEEDEIYISASSSDESDGDFVDSSEDFGTSEGSSVDEQENDRLYNGALLTVGESLLAILSFFMRHKLTGQCLGDLLSLIALLCPPNNSCLKTLHKFKSYFSMLGQTVAVFHYFCTNCETALESAGDVCEQCHENNASYFLELPLLSQLQGMFMRDGFFEALQFRFERRKKFDDNIEDVYDGGFYRQEMQNGFLSNPNNLSFMWYSDGISVYKSTNFSIWPMYLVVNELNYKARTSRENIILAGIWFGKNKPNPNLFLSPLHNDLNILQNEGHVFQRANGPPICVRAKLLLAVCDLQAKCRFMRFKQWNGYYGCTHCMIRGERYQLDNNGRSVHVYPYSPIINQRENADIPNFAQQATEARQHGGGDVDVFGIKGPTLLYNMLPNLILCMGIDAMHGIFLGLMKLLTSLWFDAAYSGMPFSIHHLLGIVDDRLSQLKPPSNVQRMPRSIQKLISFWKALEYKLLFFYYSLPVLLGVLPEILWQHHCKLISAVSILHRESISNNNIEVARQLLNSYLSDFEQLYSLRFMSINVHQIIHLPDVVLNLGPLWAYSCFFFEDLNGSVAALVHGSRHAAMQICSTASAFLTLPAKIRDLQVNNPVRVFCEQMLKGGQRQLKVSHEINPRLKIIGSLSLCDPIPENIRNALADSLNILGGRCQYVYRLLKKGLLYFAGNYQRIIQKQSNYAVILDDDVPLLGKIECFLKWTPCNEICLPDCRRNCIPRFICIARIYERVPWNIHDVPHVALSYLNRVRSNDVLRAFPVESLEMLCFYMNVEGTEYIAAPVNVLEVE